VVEGGEPRRIEVPVEMPEGMRYEGIVGSTAESVQVMAAAPRMMGVVGGVLPGPNRPIGGIMKPPPSPPPRIDAPIAALIARVKSGGRPGVDEARFVFGGAARVRIVVSDAAAVEELKKAGLKVTRITGTTIEGTVEVGKLEAVTRVAGLVWIGVR
jgi:hypothetical protein